MKTEKIIRDILFKNHRLFIKIITVLSKGAFNMKGQELEQVFGFMIDSYLRKEFSLLNPVVSVPQKKSGSDLEFNYEGDRGVDLKFYGGANRIQLSTLKSILQSIRDKFKNIESDRELSFEEKKWLINEVNHIPDEYTLAVFAKNNKRTDHVEIFVFDFNKLNISIFQDYPFLLKRVSKEKRIEIHIPVIDGSTLEISAGGNPLNRGMWLNKISKPFALDNVAETNFIKKIFSENVKINDFSHQNYIFTKAKAIIEFVNSCEYE